MRLDRWLRIYIGKIPQGLIEKYLRTGKIKLNKKKVKSNLNSRGYYKDDINRSVSLWGYYETYLKKINGHWKIIRHDFYSLGAEE